MDVTSLLNSASAPAPAPAPTPAPADPKSRSSASPAFTDSGHTVPSSTLPTPSPERAIGPAEECEKGSRSPSLWGVRSYSLQLALDSKPPRAESVFSYQTADGRIETENDHSLYNNSRGNSVCSGDITSQHNTPPRNMIIKSLVSPEQSDAEYGTDGAYNDAVGRSSQPRMVPSIPRMSAHMPSFPAVSALRSGKEAAFNHSRGISLESAQRHLHALTSRSGPGVHSTQETDEYQLQYGNKLHKRIRSAPDIDITPYSIARMPRHPSQIIRTKAALMFAAAGQKMETCTEEVGHRQGENPEMVTLSSTSSAKKQEPEEAYCMFVKDCDTGSQLRKAISHLFGRNKACTLRIPKHVWVYYCRKHYQRIRYRNAKTYPLNQMELVKLQIMRLQAWSEENRRQQDGAYIRMWTLSLRKREQSRIENGGPSGGNMDDVALTTDAARGAQVAATTTAVPEWLIQRVASGYTTDEILDVAERLHKEIKDGLLAQVPEIEFLPDIVDADSGAAAKSNRHGRRQSRASSGTRTPKRKASESIDLSRGESVAYEDRGGGRAASEYYAQQQQQQQQQQQNYHHHHYSGDETFNSSSKRPRIARPSYGAQLPPLASALSYGEMMQPPLAPVARAPNVVPRIQPLEYRRGSGHYDGPPLPGPYPGQQQQPRSRWDGYESPPSGGRDNAYALSNDVGGGGGGDMRSSCPPPPPPPPHHGSHYQPLPPPISAAYQQDARFGRTTPGPPPPLPPHQRPDHHARHHWRSASAYSHSDTRVQTAATKMPSESGRPLSSGHEMPPHHHHHHQQQHHLPPASSRGYHAVDGRREYEEEVAVARQQHPTTTASPRPPPTTSHHNHHYAGGSEHEQYTYSWPRSRQDGAAREGNHYAHAATAPPVGHGTYAPRHAHAEPVLGSGPHRYEEEYRDGRTMVYGRP